ncbi:CLUMA_CG003621, isoform A [Clunio marinus]|uniref:CLUMA_CG003621, isoform A n=1 Tax=Clunio marinus TaxID=568069 RepID=A0A1J1HUP9_9DIPT|nr:CLUMA_CG003621, isoform A [Clunio marinus]
MLTKIKKNESFSKAMLSKGASTPCDEDSNFVMELPEWADENKIKIAQRFFILNLNAMVHALAIGLGAVAAVPSILEVLNFTKKSSTPALAYRRYKANAIHSQIWYKYPIKPGTKAWKSLETVRKMHVVINRRSLNSGSGIISQKDMSITLYLFMGFHLLMPERFGIVGSREQFEAFNHFWRLIGYMLGIKDEFNCCEESLEGTRNRLEAIREDLLLPSLQFPSTGYESYTKTAIEGMWYFNPLDNNYEAMMFTMKRVMQVPGYFYFWSENDGEVEKNQKIFDSMSILQHIRIFLDIIIYEYLSKVFVFRWIFNLIRMSFGILDVYPILALRRFGKKFAYVKVLDSKQNK